MTTDVSPVTENEMRHFAERMVTSFVSLSQQAVQLIQVREELARLQTDVQYQRDRLEAVLGENANLQSQIQTVVAERDNARREAADNLALAQVFERERDQARAEVGHWRDSAEHRQNRVNALMDEAANHRSVVSDLTSKLTRAEAKLAKLQEHYRSVFEEAQVQADANPPVQDLGSGNVGQRPAEPVQGVSNHPWDNKYNAA